MPLIYQGCCAECGAVTPMTSDGYTAVLVDEPATRHAHPDDPHLVILAHPCESLILDEIGYTYQAAALGGRLVAVQNVFCLECGWPFEVRRQTAGLAALGCVGCLGVVAGAAAAGIEIGRLLGGEWVGYVAGWTTFVAFVAVADSLVYRVVRWRHASRATRVLTPVACPNCGNEKCSTAGSLRRPLPCATCGKRAVKFSVVGKS